MDKRKYIGIGVSLIIVGISFLIANFIEGFDWRLLWPIFLIIPVIFLILDYSITSEKKNHLFSIAFLIQLMIFFFVWTIGFNYENMQKMWPFFIMMPGISLLPIYLTKKNINLLIISLFLIIIGVIFSLFTFRVISFEILGKIWPIFLIIAGIFILYIYFKVKNGKDKKEI